MKNAKELDPTTTINIPEKIVVKKITGVNLVIAPDLPSWLVLNDAEKAIFDLIAAGKTIQDVFDAGYDVNDIIKVVANIEYKKFYRQTESQYRKNLYSATIYLTNACNLRCSTCYMFSGKRAEREIGVKIWKRVIKTLKENGVRTITFTGGEPMMKRGFMEILDFAYHKGLSVILLTNGTLIRESNYQFIAERCQEIQVSLDGPSKELHEEVRGPGTYERTIEAIRLLASTGKQVFIAMTPTPDTIDAFDAAFPQFFKDNDFLSWDNVDLNITAELEEGREVKKSTRLDGGSFYGKVKYVIDKYIEQDYLEKRESMAFVPGERKLNCGFGESFTVLWDGTITGCLKDDNRIFSYLDWPAGELREEMQEKFNSTQVDMLDNCRDCDLKFLCGGSCRVENRQKSGEILKGYCDAEFKNHLYDLMIKADQYTFSIKY